MSHAGAHPRPPEHSGETTAGRPGSRRAARRLVAEWVSLGISLLLILGLSAYLVREGLSGKTELTVQIRPVWDEIQRAHGRFVVPIEIRNAGPRTMRELKIGISYLDADGEKQEQEASIDYLGEKSHTRVFIFTPTDPRRARLEAIPLLYRLE